MSNIDRHRTIAKHSFHGTRRAVSYALYMCIAFSAGSSSALANTSKCLFISSYHRGYAWADGVERGIRSTLDHKCELKQFDMDTKRNKDIKFIEKQSLAAKAIIDDWKPDVVITADDNAAKYVIQQYYQNASIPFVFCGVNWTTEEYKFPYTNVTGIIEVAPIYPLLEKVSALLPQAKQATYIGANTPTELKNYERYKHATSKRSIQLEGVFPDTMSQWITAYKEAQRSDFVILGSYAGIPDWNENYVLKHIKNASKKLSITSHEWMMPFSMLGFTKIAEEQGEMAARVALSILNGATPSSIAIVPNRKWDIWTNTNLLKSSGIHLSNDLLQKSKHVH